MTADKARLFYLEALFKQIEENAKYGRLGLIVSDVPEHVKLRLEKDGYEVKLRTHKFRGVFSTDTWTDYEISWRNVK